MPQETVYLKLLDCKGRVTRCIEDGGPQPIYLVCYITNGDCKAVEFFEDELDKLEDGYQ